MLHCSARPQPLTLLGAVSLAAARFAFVTAAELIEVVVPTREDARRWLQGLHALPLGAQRVYRQVSHDAAPPARPADAPAEKSAGGKARGARPAGAPKTCRARGTAAAQS